jgi:hypothetical protein
LMQQLNSDNRKKHPILFQIIDAVKLKWKRLTKTPREKDECGKSRGQYVWYLGHVVA